MHSRYKTSSHHHSAVEHIAPTSTQHKHMHLLYSEHDARSISSCEEEEENNDSTPSPPVGRDIYTPTGIINQYNSHYVLVRSEGRDRWTEG